MTIILPFLQAWGLPVFGILLTVTIFVYQSRQRAGADTERRARANQELTELLVRRLILEHYYPHAKELVRIRDGLATKFSVDPEDLISDDALDSSVFYSVVANDYIEPAKRTEILARIRDVNLGVPSQQQVYALQKSEVSKVPSWPEVLKPLSDFSFDALTSIAASIVAAVGISIIFLPKIDNTLSGHFSTYFENLIVPIVVGGGALAMFAWYITFQRTRRERQSLDRVSLRSELATVNAFDLKIKQVLLEALRATKLKSVVEAAPPVSCDYIVERSNGEKVAIEVKSLRHAPLSVFVKWVERLLRAVEAADAKVGILVLRDEAMIPKEVDTKGLRFLKETEFVKYVNN